MTTAFPSSFTRLFSLWLLLSFSSATFASFPDAATSELSVVSHPSKLILPSGRSVEGSPDARPGVADPICCRVRIYGMSRLCNPERYAHGLKLRLFVDQGDTIFRIQTIEK